MEISKLILIIQFTLTFTSLLIQFYALFSVRWALFESRVELGLIEEHGHYGLWSMCTYHKLIPAQVDEDGKVIVDPDCDAMDTYFTPGHPRAFISFFVICHTLSLITFCSFVTFRLIELYYKNLKKNTGDDLEMNPSKTKRFFIILSRLMASRIQLPNDQEYYVGTQIRNKLYAISVAVLSTMLALAGALTPQNSLRETDILGNVARLNYQVWRGPGFWAQMTTMIMDMLITTLIVIEVKVIFHQQSSLGTDIASINRMETEGDIVEPLNDDIIVNPFFRNYPNIRLNENPQRNRRCFESIFDPRSISVNLEMTPNIGTSIQNECNRPINN